MEETALRMIFSCWSQDLASSFDLVVISEAEAEVFDIYMDQRPRDQEGVGLLYGTEHGSFSNPGHESLSAWQPVSI